MILGTTSTIQQIYEILVEELDYIPNFNPKSRIFIANQEYNIPKVQGMWVVIDQLGNKVYSNQNREYTDGDGNYREEQITLTQDIITVLVMSKNLQALLFKEGIPMALRSIFAQQQQEKLAFKIAQTMNMQNLSELEGGSRIYRYEFMINVLACYQHVKGAEYFSSFQTELRVQDGTIIDPFFEPDSLNPIPPTPPPPAGDIVYDEEGNIVYDEDGNIVYGG